MESLQGKKENQETGESGRAQLGSFESAKLKWKKKNIFLFTCLCVYVCEGSILHLRESE